MDLSLVQTNERSGCTNERSVNDVGVQTYKTKEDYLCIRNSDKKKFAPLVTKHDGVLKDASGMFE